jgi:hypothetical protein
MERSDGESPAAALLEFGFRVCRSAMSEALHQSQARDAREHGSSGNRVFPVRSRRLRDFSSMPYD